MGAPCDASRARPWRPPRAGPGAALPHALHLPRAARAPLRVGLDKVSIADPAAIPTIYQIAAGRFNKSACYDAFRSFYKGRLLDNLFATRDMTLHRHLRSAVAHAYQLGGLRGVEPRLNGCCRTFRSEMRALAGKPVDLGQWLQ